METDFFDIVAGVLQGIYQAHICSKSAWTMYFERRMKVNGFTLKKKNRQYPAQTITDADNADDIVLLANTPTQAESLLYRLEQAAGSIGFHVNANKTEYRCCNQKGDISTLNGCPLTLVNKFTYLGSSISSTESDITMCWAKAWTAIVRLSNIRKSTLSDKINHYFFSK